MQTMDSTLNIQPVTGTKRNITKLVLDILCLTIFPLIYVLGKTLLYFVHLAMDVQTMIPSPGTL